MEYVSIKLMRRSSAKKSPAYWLKAVNNLSTSFNLESREIDLVLDLLLKKLIKELGATALAVWTVEENTNFMRIEASAGLNSEFLRYFNRTDRVKVGRGFVGRVMSRRKTSFTMDISKNSKLTIPRWQEFVYMQGLE